MDGWMDGQTDGRTDGWSDGWVDGKSPENGKSVEMEMEGDF